MESEDKKIKNKKDTVKIINFLNDSTIYVKL